jgi:hypothetical protein
MKKYLVNLLVIVTLNVSAQTKIKDDFNYLMARFSQCNTIQVYLHKTDTLIKCEAVKAKEIIKPQTDKQTSFIYYGTNGKIKYKAQVGGVAGNKKSAAFMQMEKELVLLMTLKIENTVSKNEFKKDTITNKKFNPKGTEIYFYDQANFKGKQLMINVEGDFDLLAARPMWNNAISSIQVPNGYFITLYDTNPNAEGDLATYVEIGNGKNKSFTITDFKKLPALNYVTAHSPDDD